MLFPIQKEERLRELLLKKNLELVSDKELKDKYKNDLLAILFKSTRFNDISDIIRVFDRKTFASDLYSKGIQNHFCVGIYKFHYPIIRNFGYFIENLLDIFKFFERYPLIQKSLNSLLLSKKKFHLNDLLIKKLSIKNHLLKNDSFGLVILNHETLLAKKIYTVFQSYSNWFQLNLEKQYKYSNYKCKLNFSIGKIALAENKYMKAFSIFIEAIEESDKNEFKNKMIIMEWFIFCSSLLKKKNPNFKFLDEHVTFNTKNLLQAKALHYSIQTNNLILLENIIFKTGSPMIPSSSMYLHVKKFFKNVNKQVKQVLSIFARLSLQQFSKMLGISLRRVEIIMSYYLLNGVHKGYFDCENKTYVMLFKMPPRTKIKIFIEASVKLASIMNLNMQKKKLNDQFKKI